MPGNKKENAFFDAKMTCDLLRERAKTQECWIDYLWNCVTDYEYSFEWIKSLLILVTVFTVAFSFAFYWVKKDLHEIRTRLTNAECQLRVHSTPGAVWAVIDGDKCELMDGNLRVIDGEGNK